MFRLPIYFLLVFYSLRSWKQKKIKDKSEKEPFMEEEWGHFVYLDSDK
jgi:hypothetical protein